MFLKEVFSQPCFPQVSWEFLLQRWSSILPPAILCWESCHRLHTWINSSVCKGSSKICWSASCNTCQLLYCTWLVFFPDLRWALVPSPFRLPESSTFSYGSSRSPRSVSAVASLSPPHQENRIEQNSRHRMLWNPACVKAVIWGAACGLKYPFICLGTGVWKEIITSPINRVTTDTDVDSLRRMKWLCWDFASTRHFAMTQAAVLAARQRTLSGLGCLREWTREKWMRALSELFSAQGLHLFSLVFIVICIVLSMPGGFRAAFQICKNLCQEDCEDYRIYSDLPLALCMFAQSLRLE